METLEQKRVRYAWARVCQRNAEYAGLAKSAPALIKDNGLMQTLAFYENKGYAKLSGDLRLWLAIRFGGASTSVPDVRFPCVFDGEPSPEQYAELEAPGYLEVMEALVKSPSDLYMRITEESFAVLRWIRTFADTDGK